MCSLIQLGPHNFEFSRKKEEVTFREWPDKEAIFPLVAGGKEMLREILKPGIPALVYHRGEPGKGRTIAIYVLAITPRGQFSATKLLGDNELATPYGWQSVQIPIDMYDGPRRKRIEIEVIERDGERLFMAPGVMFDRLEATYEYLGGKLSVYRDGELLEETRCIDEYGGHAPILCFQGLTKVLAGYRGVAAQVTAENFRVGDMLILEICLPLDRDFDFAAFIREWAWSHAAHIRSTPVGETILVQELCTRVKKEMSRTADEFLRGPVVRFNIQRDAS